jgi:hypothetical protein
MHLGLNDGPFVSHNLILTQETLVPLLRFQVAPRLYILTHCRPVFFLYIYHESLIQRKVTFFFKSGPDDLFYVRCMYCVIKCVKTKRVLKGRFASSVFHSCNAKTQRMQISITGPQCVNVLWVQERNPDILFYLKNSGSPTGPLWREIPVHREFCISLENFT